jgi:hypothetical protein
MDIYLVLFKVVLASSIAGTPPHVIVVHEQLITVSSQVACVKYGQAEVMKSPVRDIAAGRQVFVDCEKQAALAKLT